MKTVKNPSSSTWNSLCSRPEVKREDLEELVGNILDDVRKNGDEALLRYSKKFDNIELKQLEVTDEDIEKAIKQVPDDLKEAIALAKSNIEKFHKNEIYSEPIIETVDGVKCWRKSVPIEKVGLYIPGGTAPLFSTVLMLAVPAKIAGCKEIILCTPPSKEGEINPVVLYTAHISGIKKIYKTGGAQAIAAMAFGTDTIPKVYKIFGPGNQFVTKAKEMVRLFGTDIDMPAGPSEVLVIADKNANPQFVAADLLSQAEHGVDSQVVFLSNSEALIEKVQKETQEQLAVLPRKQTAEKALDNSISVLLGSLDECVEFSNCYAPEHLIIATDNPMELADKVINAGSVFLGEYSCESAGDYASGTNHTLPTKGFAKVSGGVSVDSFMKKITFQHLTAKGITTIGGAIEKMAAAEGLDAHKNAVTIRLNSIRNKK